MKLAVNAMAEKERSTGLGFFPLVILAAHILVIEVGDRPD